VKQKRLALAAAAALGVAGLAAGRAQDRPAGEPAPVVLELFTSQGCSSCPPADRLLTRLGSSPEWRGKVVPLAFHVDYWNYIGWTDPFSQKAWSRRQSEYARAFGSRRVYTPQLVVQGRVDCNGSDAVCVERAVRAHLAQGAAWRVELAVRPAGEGKLAASVTARPRAAADRRRPAVLVALFEKGLDIEVGRGENARKTLHNDYVVRTLVRAESPDAAGARQIELALDPGWRRDQLGVAAFVQDVRTKEILGAALAAAGAD
jgi:hypothetical protein